MDAQQSLREAAARRDVGIDYLAKGRTALAIRELAHAKTLDPKDPNGSKKITKRILPDSKTRRPGRRGAGDRSQTTAIGDDSPHSGR